MPTNVVTKILVIVLENHSFTQAHNSMPFLTDLGEKYGLATDYRATTHPSLPNYLAIVSGSTWGVDDDAGPSSHRLKGSTVLSGAIAANRTAKTYCDGMVGNAQLKNGGKDYVVKHNPWVYFVNEREDWLEFDVSYDGISGRGTTFGQDSKDGNFPNVGLVIPNNVNNAHDGSLGTADRWVKDRWSLIEDSPDWKSGRLAVVITFDEDNRKEGNRVYTVVAHPSLSGKVVEKRLTHYSLTRALADVGHSPRVKGAATAPDMLAAFGLVADPGATVPPDPEPEPEEPTEQEKLAALLDQWITEHVVMNVDTAALADFLITSGYDKE